MKTRTKQIIIALLLAQGVAFGTYRLVERGRRPALPAPVAQQLSGVERAPELEIERRDGSTARVPARGRPTLLHFWASWCGPCRTELPGLLAVAAREARVELVAVSVDLGWGAVNDFFDGAVPPAIVRARDPDALAQAGAITLPDTYLVSADGRLVERFPGTRDWRSPAVAAQLAAALARLE